MTKTLKTIAAASTLILGLTSASALYAQQGPIGSGGSTPGAMMGGYGMGPGMTGGMGPGMMGGYGPGARYGSGGNGAYGWGSGYGPGMMGGYGVGPGMTGMMDMMGMMGGMGPGMMGGFGVGPGMVGGYGPGGYAALNLSADQQRKIATIRDETAHKQWPLMDKLREERYRLAQSFYASGKVDAAAARKAYQAITDARKQLFDTALDARERIDAVLARQ